MAEHTKTAVKGPASPQTSTRSRDEIERNVKAMREHENASGAGAAPDTLHDRSRTDADAHRTTSANGDDRNRTEPPAAAHKSDRQNQSLGGNAESARRHDDDDDRDKSSAQLEREVERERHELKRTLDQIRTRVSPGQMMEQALGYAREAGGAEFARNVGRSVRDNPLPVLLAGAGIGWLMISSTSGPKAAHSGGTRDRTTGLSERASGLGNMVSERADQVKDAASDMASSTREGLHRATDRAASALDSASETGSAVVDRARDSLHHAGDAARSATHDVTEYAQDVGAGAKRRFLRLAEEQPLALGAIGIAVGAAIVAMLPPSRIENRLLGPTSDSVKDQVASSVKKQYEHAREVVQETAGDVAQEFEDRGLSPQSVTDAAVDATHKAGDAAREIAEGVKTEVKQPSGTQDTQNRSAPPYGAGKSASVTTTPAADHHRPAMPGGPRKPGT